MSKAYDTLLLQEPSKHVLLVTLNRPEAANAFNTIMAQELYGLFESLALNAKDIRAVVLTGAGDRAFCAGGDLKERNGMSNADWQAQHLVYERMVRAIIACPLPVIGAINGAAYGGGCELAAALDFIYVSQTARFAQTEVRIGIIPGAGGHKPYHGRLASAGPKSLYYPGGYLMHKRRLTGGWPMKFTRRKSYFQRF